MSHITKINVKIKDLDSLKKAAARCGLQMIEHQKSFRHYNGRVEACAHAIVVPDNLKAYQVGVIWNEEEKSYDLATDFYAGGYGLTEKIGKDFSTLRSAYALECAKFTAQEQYPGWNITEQKNENGDLQLVLSQGSTPAGW